MIHNCTTPECNNKYGGRHKICHSCRRRMRASNSTDPVTANPTPSPNLVLHEAVANTEADPDQLAQTLAQTLLLLQYGTPQQPPQQLLLPPPPIPPPPPPDALQMPQQPPHPDPQQITQQPSQPSLPAEPQTPQQPPQVHNANKPVINVPYPFTPSTVGRITGQTTFLEKATTFTPNSYAASAHQFIRKQAQVAGVQLPPSTLQTSNRRFRRHNVSRPIDLNLADEDGETDEDNEAGDDKWLGADDESHPSVCIVPWNFVIKGLQSERPCNCLAVVNSKLIITVAAHKSAAKKFRLQCQLCKATRDVVLGESELKFPPVKTFRHYNEWERKSKENTETTIPPTHVGNEVLDNSQVANSVAANSDAQEAADSDAQEAADSDAQEAADSDGYEGDSENGQDIQPIGEGNQSAEPSNNPGSATHESQHKTSLEDKVAHQAMASHMDVDSAAVDGNGSQLIDLHANQQTNAVPQPSSVPQEPPVLVETPADDDPPTPVQINLTDVRLILKNIFHGGRYEDYKSGLPFGFAVIAKDYHAIEQFLLILVDKFTNETAFPLIWEDLRARGALGLNDGLVIQFDGSYTQRNSANKGGMSQHCTLLAVDAVKNVVVAAMLLTSASDKASVPLKYQTEVSAQMRESVYFEDLIKILENNAKGRVSTVIRDGDVHLRQKIFAHEPKLIGKRCFLHKIRELYKHLPKISVPNCDCPAKLTKSGAPGKRKDHKTINALTIATIIANLRRIFVHVNELPEMYECHFDEKKMAATLRSHVTLFLNHLANRHAIEVEGGGSFVCNHDVEWHDHSIRITCNRQWESLVTEINKRLMDNIEECVIPKFGLTHTNGVESIPALIARFVPKHLSHSAGDFVLRGNLALLTSMGVTLQSMGFYWRRELIGQIEAAIQALNPNIPKEQIKLMNEFELAEEDRRIKRATSRSNARKDSETMRLRRQKRRERSTAVVRFIKRPDGSYGLENKEDEFDDETEMMLEKEQRRDGQWATSHHEEEPVEQEEDHIILDDDVEDIHEAEEVQCMDEQVEDMDLDEEQPAQRRGRKGTTVQAERKRSQRTRLLDDNDDDEEEIFGHSLKPTYPTSTYNTRGGVSSQTSRRVYYEQDDDDDDEEENFVPTPLDQLDDEDDYQPLPSSQRMAGHKGTFERKTPTSTTTSAPVVPRSRVNASAAASFGSAAVVVNVGSAAAPSRAAASAAITSAPTRSTAPIRKKAKAVVIPTIQVCNICGVAFTKKHECLFDI